MSEKEFTLKFELHGDYLYAHLQGTDSFAASIDYWNQIADKVKALELTKVLVHENLTGEISEGEIFEIISDLIPTSSGIRIALFDENNLSSPINELGELVARNRGIDIRLFQSREDAESWLKEH